MAQTSIQSLEKIAKTSEDTKKLLGKLTKLNNQIGKKDETQTTKLSSLVRKVADSSFTPTFLQKFLRKPDKEGNDLATRLENTQNKIVGSIVNVFKNKEAKESVWMRARYKLISTPKGDQLFDIIKDSAEKMDLARDLPAITQTMKTELTEWRDGVLTELKAVQ